MKKIIAKFNSKCAETGIKLNKGDDIYYDPHSRKAYHPSAKKVNESIEADNIRQYMEAQESAYYDRFISLNYYNY